VAPAVDSGWRSSRVVRLQRLVRVGWHLSVGIAMAALVFPAAGRAQRRARVQKWSRGLLDILSVRVKVSGEYAPPPGAPLMLAANHVSWLDIIALNAVLPSRFVAKSELRAWPMIGRMSEQVGTLFIRRARRRDILRVNNELAQAMRDGDVVAVFPEGTTTDGATILKFHASLLQPAVLTGALLRPVAMRYVNPDGTPCRDAAFTGNRSLWDSLRLIVAQREMIAELEFLPAVENDGRHRRHLACAAREAILRTLFP
jgi:1-acyl-sn-glycerol-3-phosphate acyltransferase